ncbi:MAG: hypothetical protein L6420_09165, partial [Elusimicrobia bacterium]|nr:hypothetical protein [Elusimicrobiota bacterium]
MKKILLPAAIACLCAVCAFAEEPPEPDDDFGINYFEIIPGEYESLLNLEQSADGSFYVGGYDTLTKLEADGEKAWSVLYNADSYDYIISLGGIFSDSENNAYAEVSNYDSYQTSILKYSPYGEVKKSAVLPLAPDTYPAILDLTGSKAQDEIYVLAEYYDNAAAQGKVFIGRYNTELEIVSSVTFSGLNWGIGALEADNSGNIYY